MSRSKKPQLVRRRRKIKQQCAIPMQLNSNVRWVKFSVSKDGQTELFISSKGLPDFLIKAHAAVECRRIKQAYNLIDDAAVETVRQLVKRDPSRIDVMFVLAKTLFEIARFTNDTDLYGKSEFWYKKILKQCPRDLVYNQLGNICKDTGRMSEALKYRKKAIELAPDNAQYIAILGTLTIWTGRTQEGIGLLREALKKLGSNARIHSALLTDIHYLPNLDQEALFDEHEEWARIHAPLSKAKVSHNNTADHDRRLKVGYVSADFRLHSVAYFFESLLDGHDRQAVEVYGYGNVDCPDKITDRLKGKFDCYRDIRGMDDAAVVRLIEQDRIDILVDLSGHTADNRLPVFTYKPAPVQVSYLGYPDTTGIQAIDYRLTDYIVDPHESQKFYAEELVYLPDGFNCYKPPDFAPAVAPLPAAQNGFITFGSFNNSCKINPTVIALWAQVLKSVDKSCFLLKFKGGGDKEVKNHYLQQFEQQGISAERVKIRNVQKDPVEHFRMYGQMDIALDTYPYNGTTTTCEALWMGVPVISLVGRHHASRVGLSILSRVGLEFFAASTPAEYVAKSTALARKPEALAKIRASMRNRFAAGSLCDARKYAGHVESAYRKMWHKWCQSQSDHVPSEEVAICVE